MSEVFASNEAVIELLDPITGSTLYTVQYTRDLSLSERPVYVDRSFARSGAVTSHRLRSKGSVTLRKDAESLDLVRELKRWQQGVTYYALTSDLKGKTYRHPNLRITMTNADGTVERQVAYGVRLSDRTLSRPDGGVVGDSISLDVLRGFDLSATEAADSSRPMRALDFARTGSGTYINASGTLATATDGQGRIGLPYVVRRNLLNNTNSLTRTTSTPWTATGQWGTFGSSPPTVTVGGSLPPAGLDGQQVIKIAMPANINAYYGQNAQSVISTDLGPFAGSVWLKADAPTSVQVKISDNQTEDAAISSVSLTTTWQRVTLSGSFVSASGYNGGLQIQNDNGSSAVNVYLCAPQLERGSSVSPYQATNASGVDLANPVNGAGLVLEGAGTNYWPGSAGGTPVTLADANTTYYASINGLSGGVTYTFSADLAVTAGTGNLSAVYFKIDFFNGATYLTTIVIATYQGIGATPKRISYTFTVPAGTTSANPYIQNNSGASITFVNSRHQCEPSPFATSYIDNPTSGAVTRSADLCGIVSPHNLLRYSGDLTNSVWTNTGAGISRVGYDHTVTMVGNKGFFQKPIIAVSSASKILTYAVQIKKGTSTDAVIQLAIQTADTGSNYGTPATINASSLTSEYQTFAVTASIPANIGQVQVLLYLSSGNGTIIVGESRLVEGYQPGANVRTTDTAIPAPASSALDPAFSRHGQIEATLVVPSGTGSWTILGNTDGSLRVYQSGSSTIVSRTYSGGTATVTLPTNLADGNAHTLKVWWDDYTTSAGATVQTLNAQVDSGSIVSTNGGTWSTLDGSVLLSNGSSNCTIQKFRWSVRQPPSGAIAA